MIDPRPVPPNVNPETGVRYGAVSARLLYDEVIETIQNDGTDLTRAAEAAALRAEIQTKRPYIGETELANEVYFALEGECYDQPEHRYTRPDGLDVLTMWLGGAMHVMVLRSPHFTATNLCSPCMPGAGNLDEAPVNGGHRCYDVPPDWYRKEVA